jgi:alginate O-acetyltransferase complex protein AlgI
MREYLYYPLVAVMSGRMWRLGRFGIYLPVLTTFLFLGFWHGPSANFAIYGLLQGVMIALFDSTRDIRQRALSTVGVAGRPRLRHVLGVGFTFTVCVCPPIVFFWLTDVGAALDVFRAAMHTGGDWLSIATLAVSAERKFPFLVLGLVILQLLQIIQEKRDVWGWFERQHWTVRWACYWVLLASFIFLAASGDSQPFKYGRF